MTSAAVIIPIKSFDLAKGRLGDRLDGPSRARLAREMAATVIAAAGPLPVYVVCDSDDVAAFAFDHGANVVWRPARGLDQAVIDRLASVTTDGFERAIVAHADLPRARDLTWLAAVDGVLIVTDRRADGTNVMSLPTGSDFTFAYGPGSAAAHEREARRRGLPVEIRHDADLGWDVDLPEDLEIFDSDPIDPNTDLA